MSLLIKEKSEYINGLKSQKDIILEKIHRIKSYNNNLIKAYFPFKNNIPNIKGIITPFYSQSKNIVYDSNPNSIFKKVFIKPLIKNKDNYMTKKKYLTNNCTLNKNLNISKINKLNKSINNPELNINNNKTQLNNEVSLNETTSEYDLEKKSRIHNSNIINTKNIDNNIIDNFLNIKIEKKNNLINFKNNNNIQKLNKKKELKELNKNNNTINNYINIIDNVRTSEENDNININSGNLLSNNNIKEIKNPLYLSKLISLSNSINEIETKPQILQTDSNIKNKKINRKYKRKFYLNDNNININKTNEKIVPKINYYTSLTESNPYSKIEEIEIKGLNKSKPRNESNNSLNSLYFLETKRKILSSIEKEKKKIIDESIKNYRKYLYLIQKEQQEYEEYDQYLKDELNENQNNQKKLKLFKNQLKIGSKNKSNYDVLQNNNFLFGTVRGSPKMENKTLSTKNFDIKSNKNKNMKKFIFPKTKIKEEKNIFTSTEDYKPLTSGNNESNLTCNLKSYNDDQSYKPINKSNIKINNNNVNFRKIDPKNKNKSKKTNCHININDKTKKRKKFKNNISNLNITYLSTNALKTNNINNTYTSNSKNVINNQQHNNNKLSFSNIKKRLILKKLMKNIKNENDKKKNFKQITILNMNNNNNIKNNSLKKLENHNDYIEQKKQNIIPSINIQEIRRMIIEEKKKSLNNFNNNIIKFKENKNINDYYKMIKSKEIKGISFNLTDEKKSDSFKVKNGLYYSAFKPNKIEQKRNFILIN